MWTFVWSSNGHLFQRYTVTATLTLSSLHSFFFLLCSMNYELEIFQLQHSTCFWNLTVGCEAADGGLGAGARTSRRFIIILLSLLLLPTSQLVQTIIFACLPTRLFLKLFLLHLHEKIWMYRRSVSVCWVKVWSCYLMESWSYFTAWSYNEIGASKKSSTNLTNDTIYSGSKGMATGGLKSLDWYLLMLLLAS